MAQQRQDDHGICEDDLYRLLAENIKDYAIFTVDPTGRVTSWTAGAERLLGYRKDEIVGQSAAVLFTPEDVQRDVPRKEIEQARSTGRGEDDRWHVRKDGSRFWSSGVMTPLWDGDGNLRGLAKLMRDRTEWKQSDDARRESEGRRAAILETAPDGIITIDHEDQIVEFNPAAERLLGWRRADVLGRKMAEVIVPPRLREAHYRGIEHYLASGHGPALGKRLKLPAMRADGTEFPAELAITRVPVEGAILFTGFVRDLTERETQERRRAAELAVTGILAEATTIDDAASRILRAVGENLGWDVGVFWLIDQPTQRLRCVDAWCSPSRSAGPFVAARRGQLQSCESDLSGRVWSSGQPLWLGRGELGKFPRTEAAVQIGLHSAFAMPLRLGNQVLGVVEFLGRAIEQPDADLLRMTATLGGQIGQFIQRKAAEQALLDSEARFRNLMEQAPFSVQIFSPSGQTLQVNKAWEALWGVSGDQVVEVYNILEDQQLAAKGVLEPIQRAFAGEAVVVPAIQYDPNQTIPDLTRHRDPRRWVSAVAYPLKDPAGEIREVILVHDDITARKQAEDALRESEERFRGIVSHSIAGVAEVDLTGRFLFANQRYCDIVGRSPTELLGLTMQEISHPDDLPRNLPLFQRIRHDGVPYVIEKRYLRPNGSEVWVSNSVSGLRDHDGQVKSVVAVCVDVTDRRHAEEALREEKERLQTLIDNLPRGAVYRAVQNPEAGTIDFTFLSAGVEQVLGVTAEEGIADASRLYQAIHPDDRDRVSQEEKQSLRTLEQFNAEFRIYHRSGQLRWLHCRSIPHRLPSGSIAWEGIFLDVTDTKLAEKALRENEDRLRLALEAGEMGTWSWDISTNTVQWSPQLEAIHGIPTGSFPGTFEAYQQDMHPEDRERVLASIQRALSTGEDHHLEYRLVLPDGSIRWVEARGSVFRDQAGQPTYMIGVCTEITERMRREQDLRFLADASRSLAGLVDHKSTLQRIASLAVPHFADWCTIYLPEESGTLRPLAVAHVDPAKIQLADELRRRWPPDPNAPGGVYQVFRTRQSVLVEDVPEEMLRELVKDDEYFEILRTLGLRSYMCVPLTVRQDIIGVMTFIAAESGRRYTAADLALAEDLARRAAIASENARLYATLREESQRKDEFLAMLAHELRNPLAPIRSGLDLLGMMGGDAEILGPMQQQVDHLVRLVDDLLDVSRIMRGKIELRKEPVDLASIVGRAVDTVRPSTAKLAQSLSVDMPSQPVWIDADSVRMTQVIGNLLNNASKYTETGGRIELAVVPQESHVVVRVRDTGIGISAELLPHVFDLFTQDQRTIDRSQGGLGIGLTVVKNLVEMHGGNVTVRSGGRGQGSEFSVQLPIRPSAATTESEPPQAPSTPGLRILVVDDNVTLAKMLGRLLVKLGSHHVSMAHDGMAALAAARQHKPDLILLDIGLPSLDGFEVARQLRQHPEFQQVRLVALTGYGTEDDRRKSLEAGFDAHLVKPPGVETLQRLLGDLARDAAES